MRGFIKGDRHSMRGFIKGNRHSMRGFIKGDRHSMRGFIKGDRHSMRGFVVVDVLMLCALLLTKISFSLTSVILLVAMFAGFVSLD